jgi:adenylate kinase family enzyme
MKKIIIIRGPAGSGKTTTAKALHERTSETTAFLPFDFFRIDVAKNQKSAADISTEIIEFATKKFLDSGYIVILESIFNVDKPLSKRLFDSFKDNSDTKLFHIYLGISLDKAKERNRQRSKGKVITDEEIEEWYPLSRPLQKEENQLILNMDTLNDKEVFDKAISFTGLHIDDNSLKAKYFSWRI